METLRLGISAYLMGENVRFDGGYKLDRFLRDTLGKFVEYVPVCPEVECGLGVPREAMHLEGDPASPRLVTVRTKKDLTDRMLDWAKQRVRELEREELCGFIFKSDSPSSGMARVKIYDAHNVPHRAGVGMFASVFMKHFPLLPVEEEGRLHDPMLRENYIGRIFVAKRWRDTTEGTKKVSRLMDFHTRHKLLIMAHSPKHAGVLRRLLANSQQPPIEELYSEYHRVLMEALMLKATAKKHTNVLQHLMGYFKKELSTDEKQELLEVIESYRQGYLPLIVPVTLISHYVRKYHQLYLSGQYYLNPHPIELQLRNHA
jgi:uncharacterized protein YbgA (DUF1722 family)/uncharacterized protein YbbK (DUF523 family)